MKMRLTSLLKLGVYTIASVGFAISPLACDDSGDDTSIETPVQTYDLANYPSQYIADNVFEGRIVIGVSAPASDAIAAVDIATSLQYAGENPIQRIDVGTVALDSTLSNLEQNLIIIGMKDPVNGNSILDNYTLPNLNDGEGLLKIVNHNNYAHLIVSGYSTEDVRKASRVLADYEFYDLSGDEIFIVGTPLLPEIKTLDP
jgi:hypothetical protein